MQKPSSPTFSIPPRRRAHTAVVSFDGRVVAKLPFEPFGIVQSISHRNLMGKDITDCSFLFLYILCTMSIREVSLQDHTPLPICKTIYDHPRMSRRYSDLDHLALLARWVEACLAPPLPQNNFKNHSHQGCIQMLLATWSLQLAVGLECLYNYLILSGSNHKLFPTYGFSVTLLVWVERGNKKMVKHGGWYVCVCACVCVCVHVCVYVSVCTCIHVCPPPTSVVFMNKLLTLFCSELGGSSTMWPCVYGTQWLPRLPTTFYSPLTTIL